MQERVQKKHPSRTSERSETEPLKVEDKNELKSEMDEILDEIDEVLEQNAEEFVKSYIQKGGE